MSVVSAVGGPDAAGAAGDRPTGGDPGRPTDRGRRTVSPDLRQERALLRAGARVLVGMDEVGRGALAGPVSVGVVAVDLTTRSAPPGLADSKLLTPAARERLAPALARWGVSRGVGHASPEEIDRLGIVGALREAGRRALAALAVPADLVLLDGSHDWLSSPGDLFDHEVGPAVVTRVGADRRCAAVAAASVLAKVERDAIMVALDAEVPGYGWARNKGYGAPDHLAALRARGASAHHRRSWRLPGCDGPVPGGAGEADAAGVVVAGREPGADGG